MSKRLAPIDDASRLELRFRQGCRSHEADARPQLALADDLGGNQFDQPLAVGWMNMIARLGDDGEGVHHAILLEHDLKLVTQNIEAAHHFLDDAREQLLPANVQHVIGASDETAASARQRPPAYTS